MINRPGHTAPTIKRITPTTEGGHQIGKDDLKNRTWVITLREYDNEWVGQYDPTQRAVFDVIEVGGDSTRAEQVWIFGATARILGENLKPGETSVGTFVEKKTKTSGRTYLGIDFTQDPAVLAAAELLLTPPF
jgi:hypothetical protein